MIDANAMNMTTRMQGKQCKTTCNSLQNFSEDAKKWRMFTNQNGLQSVKRDNEIMFLVDQCANNHIIPQKL